MNAPYQICSATIMDTTADPDITFDANGVCNYVGRYNAFVSSRIPSEERAGPLLASIMERIKQAGKGKEYDCVIGVSGGVDSTYTAYYAKKILGLRPLAVHMDNGWNSELAVSNIEKTLKKLDIELHTEVLDWNEFRDLQLSFLMASTPDGEVPTDHAIWGVLYRVAAKYGIGYIISGTNARTEGILPRSWAQGHLDTRYLDDIQSTFGKVKLRTFPRLSPFHLFHFIMLKRIKKINLLDYIGYSKKEAMRVLQDELGWVYYGGKHYESVYTRFFQGYILPRKFSIDKRRAHLSSLICAGEITRDEALAEIAREPYPTEEMLRQDLQFVKKKLGMSDEEFDRIMQLPVKKYTDYKNNKSRIDKLMKLYKTLFAHGDS
jgi:N-acetyl sugar amidotransferase